MAGCIRNTIARICKIDSAETIRLFKIGLLVRILFSCLIDADRTDTADFSKPDSAFLRQHGRYDEWSKLSNLLECELRRFSADTAINQLRKQVGEFCLSAAARPRGAFTLTVPTGGGKTLASLRFALTHAATWEMDRIIYVNPYTSILDQNADVVRKILEPAGAEFGSVVLETSLESDTGKANMAEQSTFRKLGRPRRLHNRGASIGGALRVGTRAVRRLHQMANSVLIFDEIQTLPVRCVHLFNNAMNFLVEQCGASVVLCTATQPLLHLVSQSKGAMRLGKDAEIVPDVHALFGKVQRNEVVDCRRPGGWEHAETASWPPRKRAEPGVAW